MAREILFRGKCKDTGEWVRGYYVHVPLGIRNSERHYILTGRIGAWKRYWNFQYYEVLPETVGQFTGLLDKNGTKIFEGDILKGFEYPFFRKEDGTHNYFAEVVWFNNSPAFGLWTFKNPESTVSGISHGNSDYIEDFNSEMWEVIGNIHDNPEGVQ